MILHDLVCDLLYDDYSLSMKSCIDKNSIRYTVKLFNIYTDISIIDYDGINIKEVFVGKLITTVRYDDNGTVNVKESRFSKELEANSRYWKIASYLMDKEEYKEELSSGIKSAVIEFRDECMKNPIKPRTRGLGFDLELEIRELHMVERKVIKFKYYPLHSLPLEFDFVADLSDGDAILYYDCENGKFKANASITEKILADFHVDLDNRTSTLYLNNKYLTAYADDLYNQLELVDKKGRYPKVSDLEDAEVIFNCERFEDHSPITFYSTICRKECGGIYFEINTTDKLWFRHASLKIGGKRYSFEDDFNFHSCNDVYYTATVSMFQFKTVYLDGEECVLKLHCLEKETPVTVEEKKELNDRPLIIDTYNFDEWEVNMYIARRCYDDNNACGLVSFREDMLTCDIQLTDHDITIYFTDHESVTPIDFDGFELDHPILCVDGVRCKVINDTKYIKIIQEPSESKFGMDISLHMRAEDDGRGRLRIPALQPMYNEVPPLMNVF